MEVDRGEPRARLGGGAPLVHGRGCERDRRCGCRTRAALTRAFRLGASLPGHAPRRWAGQAPQPSRAARPKADLGNVDARGIARGDSGRRRPGAGARPERQPRSELGRRAREAPRPGGAISLCELELDSTDYLPRAALLGAPLNPTRKPTEAALRFRVSAGRGLPELRNVSRDGEALSRAHGRRRSHGSHERRERAFGHGLRGDAGSGLAHSRSRRLTFGVRPVGV